MHGLLRVFTVIQSSYEKRKLSCEIKNSSVMLQFVVMLRRQCVIYGCEGGATTHLVIFLRYVEQRPLISKIKIISKPGARKHVSKFKEKTFDSAAMLVRTNTDGLLGVSSSFWCSGELLCKL